MFAFSIIISQSGQIDYSIILAIISIIVSIVTLYIAQIRGPQTKLVLEGKYIKILETRRSSDALIIKTRLFIANIGIRTGIL
jgi:hypothetical protein